MKATARAGDNLGHYLLVVLTIALLTALNTLLLSVLDYWAISLIYLFAVSVLALFTSLVPGLLAAALSAVLWVYFFIPYRYSVVFERLEDGMMFGMYFFIALITGFLNARVRSHMTTALLREKRILALYELSREVARAATLDDVLATAVCQIKRVMDADVAIFLAAPGGQLDDQPHPASRYTHPLTQAEGTCVPLQASGNVLGALVVRPRRAGPLSGDQQVLLEAFADQVAVAIERELLNEKAKRALMLGESERLYKTLFNLISHEFRTPITAIAGAAGTLLDPRIGGDPSLRAAQAREIQEAAERLNRLVKNLLDMARLESGTIRPNLDWCDVGDLVSVALGQVERELAGHPLVVDLPPDLPLVRADFVLMEQVLVNLLRNAATYTPPGTAIAVRAAREADELVLVVEDRGPALPSDALVHVFDKFYRARDSGGGGTGLGLTISRGLVEVNRGAITAENAPEGGARFVIRLPVEPYSPVPQEAPA